jgi:predicted amidohydrolase
MNMRNFNVALMQLRPDITAERNLEKGLFHCKVAKIMGADIALFPEMWSNGYTLSDNPNENMRKAITLDSEYIKTFQEHAKYSDIAIGITFLEKYEPSPRNSLVVIDRHGDIVLHYAKIHTCVFDSGEAQLTAGDNFPVADLDTRNGIVKIGAMICYDREQPESARVLMLKGAEIIFVPNACPMEINRLSQLRGRAYENMVGIATANYPYGHPDCNGHSSAFDGMAYRINNGGNRDTLVVEAGEAEGIFMASFPIEEMREYRRREIHGNAYRRPELYHLLTKRSEKYVDMSQV